MVDGDVGQRHAQCQVVPPRLGSGEAGEAPAVGLGRGVEDRLALAGGGDEGERRGGRSPAAGSVAELVAGLIAANGSGRRRSLVRMRVGLVCPYSLSIPGGVQAQVLGLARVAARARASRPGCSAPCDGPPPELFVTPLGNSLPTAANGSVAPLAPGPRRLRCARSGRCATRTSTSSTSTSRSPPGRRMTALLIHPAPIVATFHAAGDSAVLPAA